MSEAKKKYLENPTHYNLLNYTAELEKEKAELIELLSDIAHFTKIESKKTQCYPAWWYRIEDCLKNTELKYEN